MTINRQQFWGRGSKGTDNPQAGELRPLSSVLSLAYFYSTFVHCVCAWCAWCLEAPELQLQVPVSLQMGGRYRN